MPRQAEERSLALMISISETREAFQIYKYAQSAAADYCDTGVADAGPGGSVSGKCQCCTHQSGHVPGWNRLHW